MYHPLNASTIEKISAAQVSIAPLPHEAEIRILEFTIRGVEVQRAFQYKCGDLYGARLQAIRLGCMRAELRRMKGK